MPPVGRQRKPHTSPAQISVLPSPTSTVFTRRCHPLAFTSVSPIFDQRRSRDPPADVPARLQENSGTTPQGSAKAQVKERANRLLARSTSHWQRIPQPRFGPVPGGGSPVLQDRRSQRMARCRLRGKGYSAHLLTMSLEIDLFASGRSSMSSTALR